MGLRALAMRVQMTKSKHFKKKVRARSLKTGERYTTARHQMLKRDGGGGGGAPIQVELYGPPRFHKLSFSIVDYWGWSWLRNGAIRDKVFKQLDAKVASEQPEILADVRAALELYPSAPNDVIVEAFIMDARDDHFWIGLNLFAVEDVKVNLFLRAAVRAGVLTSEEDWGETWQYYTESSRPAEEFLADLVKTWRREGVIAASGDKALQRSVAAALRLDEVSCSEALSLVAEHYLDESRRDEMPWEFEEKGTSEPGYISTLTTGGRTFNVVIGDRYLCALPSYAEKPKMRECILVAVDDALTPSRGWVRWLDDGVHTLVDAASLFPI